MPEDELKYTARDISPEEKQVVEAMVQTKKDFGTVEGYVTLNEDTKLITWDKNLPVETSMVETIVPLGTTLRIVTISKFNDFGLTNDLAEPHGYKVRIPIDAALLSDIRLHPEPSSAHAKIHALVTHKEEAAPAAPQDTMQ